MEIDKTKNKRKTNDYGIAYFTLLVLEGKNGKYKLSFSAEGAATKASSTFSLINPILNVNFYQNCPQIIQVLYLFYIYIYFLFFLDNINK